ncbi:MAG: transposase [Bacteroidota bacterium]
MKKLQVERDEQINEVKRKNAKDKEREIYMIRRAYFYEYDQLLDSCKNSPTHLANRKVAEIVETALRKHDQQLYNLVAFTLMPNHLHVVLDFSIQVRKIVPFNLDLYTNVSAIMNQIKGSSGFYANKIIGNTGTPFWSVSYYDRYIRNMHHYLGAVNYTINNAVKAKIATHWMEHSFTWLNPDYQKFELIFPKVNW